VLNLIKLFAAVIFLASPAFAQTNINLGGVRADTTAPVEVSADNLNVDQDTGTAGEISRLNASGGVTFVTETEAAEAASATYDLVAGTLTLNGEVLLTQGPSAISAESMTINLEKQLMKPALTVQDGDVGLRIVNLRKSYRKRPVIRDVSIDLGRTCFYSIAGLVTPEGGQVIVDGRDVTTLPMYRRAKLGIGYLPQEMSIFRGLSVEDNIRAILEIAVPDRHKRRERLEELLSEFSIEHLRRAPALALSGGERRRVEIARCLAAGPKYVLLDEPFAGVDPNRSQRSGNAANCRSRLYSARRQSLDERHDKGSHRRRKRAPRLPWIQLPR